MGYFSKCRPIGARLTWGRQLLATYDDTTHAPLLLLAMLFTPQEILMSATKQKDHENKIISHHQSSRCTTVYSRNWGAAAAVFGD